MLLFHGGLPRSGKSYESVVKHLIPALKKGRKVYARIDGLNYEKIASVAEISIERCNELLIHLTEDQVETIEDLTFDVGSLIVLDEAQNYWPDARKPLNPKITKFVAEHGHQGLDILLMGQEFTDLHKLWKNRVSQRVDFRKLDMVGKSTKYVWVLSKAIKPQKFEEVSKGTEEYDPKYFGTYKSFEEGAEGAQLYDDKRASIWQHPIFKKWGPIFLVLLAVACWQVYKTWNGGLQKMAGAEEPKKHEKEKAQSSAAPAPTSTASAPQPEQKTATPKDGDIVREMSEKYRLRVSGIIKSAHRQHAVFEWYDESMRVKERMTMLMVAQLGYAVTLDDDMQYATLEKGGSKYVATQFPTESDGRISESKNREIAGYPDRVPPVASSGQPSVPVTGMANGYGVKGPAGNRS